MYPRIHSSSYFQLLVLNCCSLTKVPSEDDDLPRHKTGSARTEGFYKISTKDKRKYISSTKPTAGLPSTQVFKSCSCEHLGICFNAFSKCLFREPASPPNSQYHCVGDLTSGWNSVGCSLPSIAIAICSSSTN